MSKVTVAGFILVMVFFMIVASTSWLQKTASRGIFKSASCEVDY
jgi:hypothetical protein